MENVIYIVLLVIHNIALVGCAAAPFYNLRLVNQRAQFGKKLCYQLDKVVYDFSNQSSTEVFLGVPV